MAQEEGVDVAELEKRMEEGEQAESTQAQQEAKLF